MNPSLGRTRISSALAGSVITIVEFCTPRLTELRVWVGPEWYYVAETQLQVGLTWNKAYSIANQWVYLMNYKTYILNKNSRKFPKLPPDHGVGLISQHIIEFSPHSTISGLYMLDHCMITYVLWQPHIRLQVPITQVTQLGQWQIVSHLESLISMYHLHNQYWGRPREKNSFVLNDVDKVKLGVIVHRYGHSSRMRHNK